MSVARSPSSAGSQELTKRERSKVPLVRRVTGAYVALIWVRQHMIVLSCFLGAIPSLSLLSAIVVFFFFLAVLLLRFPSQDIPPMFISPNVIRVFLSFLLVLNSVVVLDSLRIYSLQFCYILLISP